MDSTGEEMFNTDSLYRIMIDDVDNGGYYNQDNYICDLVLCFNAALFQNDNEKKVTHVVIESYPKVDWAYAVMEEIYDAIAQGKSVYKVPHPVDFEKGRDNHTQKHRVKSDDSQKCVYVLGMNNETVKIGVTQDFQQRVRTIISGSGLEVLKSHHSHYMPSSAAFKIESKLHTKFKDHRVKGEFFRISFPEACDELQKLL